MPIIETMLLRDCRVNARVRLMELNLAPDCSLRVQELGLRPGAEATVTQRAAFGGVVLNVGGARVAVDYRSTKRIRVEAITDRGPVKV